MTSPVLQSARPNAAHCCRRLSRSVISSSACPRPAFTRTGFRRPPDRGTDRPRVERGRTICDRANAGGSAARSDENLRQAVALAALCATDGISALAHITGGGFPENIPRVLPKSVGIEIDLTTIPVPPVFSWLAREGEVAEREMLRTFNCGIGMIVVAAHETAGDDVLTALREAGEQPVLIGHVIQPSDGDRVKFTGRLAL